MCISQLHNDAVTGNMENIKSKTKVPFAVLNNFHLLIIPNTPMCMHFQAQNT